MIQYKYVWVSVFQLGSVCVWHEPFCVCARARERERASVPEIVVSFWC